MKDIHTHSRGQVLAKNRYRKLLPRLYSYLVFIGLAATGAQANFLPKFVLCSKFFGEYSCDPFGNYLIAFSSFPGLLIAGQVSSKWSNISAVSFFLILFISSLVIYFLIGLLS